MLAHLQSLVASGAGYGAVDGGELAAAGLVPLPHVRGRIRGKLLSLGGPKYSCVCEEAMLLRGRRGGRERDS